MRRPSGGLECGPRVRAPGVRAPRPGVRAPGVRAPRPDIPRAGAPPRHPSCRRHECGCPAAGAPPPTSLSFVADVRLRAPRAYVCDERAAEGPAFGEGCCGAGSARRCPPTTRQRTAARAARARHSASFVTDVRLRAPRVYVCDDRAGGGSALPRGARRARPPRAPRATGAPLRSSQVYAFGPRGRTYVTNELGRGGRTAGAAGARGPRRQRSSARARSAAAPSSGPSADSPDGRTATGRVRGSAVHRATAAPTRSR